MPRAIGQRGEHEERLSCHRFGGHANNVMETKILVESGRAGAPAVPATVTIVGFPGSVDAAELRCQPALKVNREVLGGLPNGFIRRAAAVRRRGTCLSDGEMSTERGELSWITSFDPAWPKYFADPDSPRVAARLAGYYLYVKLIEAEPPRAVGLSAGQHREKSARASQRPRTRADRRRRRCGRLGRRSP